MTRPIPAGTRNLCVNVTEDEWLLLKSAAAKFDSLGDLVRTLIVDGATVSLPAMAKEIHAVGLWSVASSWTGESHDMRRAKARVDLVKLVKAKKSGTRGHDQEGEA